MITPLPKSSAKQVTEQEPKQTQSQDDPIQKLNIQTLTSTTLNCPICKAQGVPFYNRSLHDVVHNYMLSNPDDMETPQAFVPEKPKCFLCQQDIKFEKKF